MAVKRCYLLKVFHLLMTFTCPRYNLLICQAVLKVRFLFLLKGDKCHLNLHASWLIYLTVFDQ